MRPLLVTVVLFALCLVALLWYRDHVNAGRDAARAFVPAPPAAPVRSLEERAAAAQGTTLPPQARLTDSRLVRPESIEREDSAPIATSYRCDGRTRCPQMHSCAEATWFLQNCSGMKMDGDSDGVPCEDQWCPKR